MLWKENNRIGEKVVQTLMGELGDSSALATLDLRIVLGG